MKLALVVSAYNEEKKIADCLESVKGLVDEIIVVNNSSTDKTESIAKKYTPHVFTRQNNPTMLNINKNYGFTKAHTEWILNLDADERVTPDLALEIRTVLGDKNDKTNGYLIPRKNIIFKKWIKNSIWWPDYQLRLFRKDKGRFAQVHVHELIDVEGEVEKLENPMIHYNYESISQYLYKLEKLYTENEAEVLIANGKKLHWYDAVKMPVSDFLKTYFLQKGYRDGLHGLVLCMLQGFYAEVLFAKVWEKQGFYEEEISLKQIYTHFNKLGVEFNYWFLTAFLDEEKNSFRKTLLKVKRKHIQRKL